MEGSIIVSMTYFIKHNIIYLVLLLIFLYKGILINISANINSLLTKNNNNEQTEVNMLTEENKQLKKDIEEITKLKDLYNTDYKLTRLSYRLSYTDNDFYITGDDYQVNDLLINESGLVGIIKEIKKDYSLATTIKGIKNLSIKINDTYGTVSEYKDDLFIAKDISNYDNVKINDEVYTSNVGSNNNIIYVGSVIKIEEHDISKTIYIKSKVDFNNINYLYVVG